MPTSLDSIFFAGPYLLCYCVRSRPHLSIPVANSLSSFSQPTLFSRPVTSSDHAEISSPKNLLSGFAPKQTKESSAWRATHIVLHRDPNRSIRPLIGTLTYTTSPDSSESVNNGNKKVPQLPQASELESHHWIQFCIIHQTPLFWRKVTDFCKVCDTRVLWF